MFDKLRDAFIGFLDKVEQWITRAKIKFREFMELISNKPKLNKESLESTVVPVQLELNLDVCYGLDTILVNKTKYNLKGGNAI